MRGGISILISLRGLHSWVPNNPYRQYKIIIEGKDFVNQFLEQIKELCQIDGISGRETAVREAIIKQLDGCCDYETDNRGNLICHKKGRQSSKKKVMFTAHMDEAGFMLTGIREDGLLSFSNVGDIDSRMVVGKPVRIDGALPGAVGCKPIHLQTADEQSKPLKTEDLYIDIGADNREIAARAVKLGAGITFDGDFAELGNGCFASKACDSRAACALLIALLKEDLDRDCTVVFNVSTETGTTGAANVAYSLKPDIAVILSSIPSDEGSSSKGDSSLGRGVILALKDETAFFDEALYTLSVETAKELALPYQETPVLPVKNESRAIQTSCAGVKVMTIGLPCRYTHSISAMMQICDLESAKKLLNALAEKL